MEVAHSLNTVTSFYTHPFSRPQEMPVKKEATFKCKCLLHLVSQNIYLH